MAGGIGALLTLKVTPTEANVVPINVQATFTASGAVTPKVTAALATLQGKTDSANRLLVRFV